MKFDTLGVEGRIDHTLLRTRLEYELRLLAREQKWVADAATLVPFSGTITALLEARGRLEPMDAEKTATTLEEVTAVIELANGRSARPPSRHADRRRRPRARPPDQRLSRGRGARQPQTELTAWNRFYTRLRPALHVVGRESRTQGRQGARRLPQGAARERRRRQATAKTSRSSAIRSAARRCSPTSRPRSSRTRPRS